MNMYRYCINNPVNMMDPSGCGGLDPCICYGVPLPSRPPPPPPLPSEGAGNLNSTGATTTSKSEKRRPRIGEDTSCGGICKTNIIGNAYYKCLECCAYYYPEYKDSNKASTCWGVRCAVSVMPDVFEVPGFEPIPGWGGATRETSPP
jgi:hypothetical protein